MRHVSMGRCYTGLSAGKLASKSLLLQKQWDKMRQQ